MKNEYRSLKVNAATKILNKLKPFINNLVKYNINWIALDREN